MKTINLLMVSVFVISACSKTITTTESTSLPYPLLAGPQNASEENRIDLAKKILNSKAPNLALAQLLTKSLNPSEKAQTKVLVESLEAEEIQIIIEQVKKDQESIKSFYLFHKNNYQGNTSFINRAILNPNQIVSSPLSFEDQIQLSVFAYLKNKALDEIVHTYDKKASELVRDLAKQVAAEMYQEDEAQTKMLENSIRFESEVIAKDRILKSKPFIKKADKLFRDSNLNENEQYAVVASGALAFAIYTQVRDNKTFRHLANEARQIINDIKTIQKKATEFKMLINTLDKHTTDLSKNTQDLADGMKGSRTDLMEMYSKAKKGLTSPNYIESKKVMSFLYDKVINGKDIKDDGKNPSIFSKQIEINKNVTKSIYAAGEIASNLSNILDTTQKLGALFGVKPSNDLMKIMDKASKVSQVVSLANSVITGLSTGGILGAFSALSSGPLSSMLSGGNSGVTGQLSQINKKLDIIMRQQQKMMEMQVETMKMIKDLALLVDQYHQTEMTALAELRDYSLVQIEFEKAKLNKELRSCERMINFQLRSVWNDQDFKFDSTYGISSLKVVNDNFISRINSLQGIQRIISSLEENGFQNCQNAISEAFGGNSTDENPTRAIFATSESENLYRFQRETYLPLLNSLGYFTNTINFDSIPLHIPSENMDGLSFKSSYLKDTGVFTEGESTLYDMENLISVKILERYLNQLLILYPVLEVDKSIWYKGFEEITNTYLNNSNPDTNQNIRSYYYLSNALKLIQSSIAQESLLSGEPLLKQLHDRYSKKIISSQTCESYDNSEMPSQDAIPYICMIRSNKLLMKNFILFSLYNNREFQSYKLAYDNKNMTEVASLFKFNLRASDFEIKRNDDRDEIYLRVLGLKSAPILIKLPTPEELKAGKIIYSENMGRLIQMQNATIESLEKVAPVDRPSRGTDLIHLLFLGI